MNLTLRLANYITRYAPSDKRIRAYLTKKKCQDIQKILTEIGYDESLMCQMWMRSFIALGKGEREIRMKLMKKEFSKDLIVAKIAEFETEIMNWDDNKNQVAHQIRTLHERGKSKQFISQTLVSKYPYFKDEIRSLIEDNSDTQALGKELQKYSTRYNIQDPKERQKLYAALLRKGFRYDDIKKYLANTPDDEEY